MTATARWAGVSCVLLALAGCGAGSRCGGTDQPYLKARGRPALQVPEGLDMPNRNDQLSIPDGSYGTAQPVVNGRCLDEPPPYFGSAGAVAGSAEEAVAVWANAWASRDASRVRNAYSSRFQAPGETATADWLEQRTDQVATGPVPSAAVENLEVATVGADQRVATFVQRFGTNAIRKELMLVREGSTWRILSERVVEVL